MERGSYLILILLISSLQSAFAHSDFYTFKDYGNVKVRVKTGYRYEEIYKAFIIGQLAQKLSTELKYKEEIFLDFDHHYTSLIEPDYFISFDKGKIKDIPHSSLKEEDLLKEKSLVVRQVSSKFNIASTLKLVEFGIKNLSEIKSKQRQIEYNQNYNNWQINTIDTTLIERIIKTDTSPILSDILDLKIERPVKENDYDITYYWQNGKYSIVKPVDNKPYFKLLELENIYVFEKVSNYSLLIFDSDSSFYHINQYNQPLVSKRQIIQGAEENFVPFVLDAFGDNKISIFFYFYTNRLGPQPKKRNLIYLIDKDKLIQDLDKLLESN